MIPKWLFLPAVFRPFRTVFPGLGAGFLNLAGQTERTAKKRGKNEQKWARNGLKRVGVSGNHYCAEQVRQHDFRLARGVAPHAQRRHVGLAGRRAGAEAQPDDAVLVEKRQRRLFAQPSLGMCRRGTQQRNLAGS